MRSLDLLDFSSLTREFSPSEKHESRQ